MSNNVRVFQFGQDTVRVHGEPNMAAIRAATEKFMREVEKQRNVRKLQENDKRAAACS